MRVAVPKSTHWLMGIWEGVFLRGGEDSDIELCRGAEGLAEDGRACLDAERSQECYTFHSPCAATAQGACQ